MNGSVVDFRAEVESRTNNTVGAGEKISQPGFPLLQSKRSQLLVGLIIVAMIVFGIWQGIFILLIMALLPIAWLATSIWYYHADQVAKAMKA